MNFPRFGHSISICCRLSFCPHSGQFLPSSPSFLIFCNFQPPNLPHPTPLLSLLLRYVYTSLSSLVNVVRKLRGFFPFISSFSSFLPHSLILLILLTLSASFSTYLCYPTPLKALIFLSFLLILSPT